MTSRRIMAADDMRRAITRIGHEIVEKHGGTTDLGLVGVERRGPEIAARIAAVISAREGVDVPVGRIDAGAFRDDRSAADAPRVPTALPFEPASTTVVLVDDVLFTGRTARAAIDALIAAGRPRAVKLAVLVDRGHRELPVRADHVGKNVPTARDERIEVRLAALGADEDEVRLVTAVGES